MWEKAWLIAVLLLGLVAGAAAETDSNVTQQATGKPLKIEGIIVNQIGAGVKDAQVRLERVDAEADEPPLAEAKTSDLGEVQFELQPPIPSSIRVLVIAEKYSEYRQELDLTDPGEMPFFDVTLESVGKIGGKVRSYAGRPLADVLIACSSRWTHKTTRSDADGHYEFDNVFNGPVTVSAQADGFADAREQIEVESEEAELDLDLGPEQRVELEVVTDDDEPAPEVLIEAIAGGSGAFASATTDDKGRATLKGLPANAPGILVRLSGDRYVQSGDYSREIPFVSTSTQPQENTADTQPAVAEAQEVVLPVIRRKFVITVAATLKGKVTDTAGDAVVGVRVSAGTQQRADNPVTWTRLDGTYELRQVRPGFVTITLVHGDYAPLVQEADLRAGQVRELDLQLDVGRPLGGMVVDEQGKPLDEVRVRAERWRGYETLPLRDITGEDGRFHFARVPDGEIEFSFTRPGSGAPVVKKLNAGKTDYRVTVRRAVAPPSPSGGTAEGEAGPEEKIKTGQSVPELEFTLQDGTKVKLSDYRGKYVFLDFWATWCGPCVAEIPSVKTVREATRNRKDFVLIGISLDRDQRTLQRAIGEHKMDWPQVSGPNSGAENVFAAFNGVFIPYTCLIAPDGKIVAQGLRGEAMVQRVQEILDNKPPATQPKVTATQPG